MHATFPNILAGRASDAGMAALAFALQDLSGRLESLPECLLVARENTELCDALHAEGIGRPVVGPGGVLVAYVFEASRETLGHVLGGEIAPPGRGRMLAFVAEPARSPSDALFPGKEQSVFLYALKPQDIPTIAGGQA